MRAASRGRCSAAVCIESIGCSWRSRSVPDLALLWRKQLGPDLLVGLQRQEVHTSSPAAIGVVVHVGDDGGLDLFDQAVTATVVMTAPLMTSLRLVDFSSNRRDSLSRARSIRERTGTSWAATSAGPPAREEVQRPLLPSPPKADAELSGRIPSTGRLRCRYNPPPKRHGEPGYLLIDRHR